MSQKEGWSEKQFKTHMKCPLHTFVLFIVSNTDHLPFSPRKQLAAAIGVSETKVQVRKGKHLGRMAILELVSGLGQLCSVHEIVVLLLTSRCYQKWPFKNIVGILFVHRCFASFYACEPHALPGAQRSQKRVSGCLELGWNWLCATLWVLGIKPASSRRSTSTFNC